MTNPLRDGLAALLSALMLVGCGGGGGGGGSGSGESSEHRRPTTSESFALMSPHHAADARHMPVYAAGSYSFVGVDQGAGHIGRLPEAAARGDVTIRHGGRNDGVGRDTVVSYLADATGGPAMRYPTAPTVRVIGRTNQQNVNRVMTAVRLVNAALPDGAKITVSAPLPGLSLTDMIDREGYIRWSNRALNNTIHVEFSPCADYYACGTSGGTTWNYPWTAGTATQRSYIQMNADAVALRTDRQATILLAHEIMHALGLYAGYHVSPAFDSIMLESGLYATRQGIPQPTSLLYPVDREALRALYSRLNAGDSFDDLGAWTSSSMHIAGDGPHATFGVALRNGYAEPWAYGVRPATTLANNRSLSGLATWTGALVGLTPSAEAVAGDAEIGVGLATMRGTVNFTTLESWAARAAPGAAGTGTQWLDGDLAYTIAVTGNTFRETGGDDGTLTGIFTGRNHEGAAGTLERSDLTAAFGASR